MNLSELPRFQAKMPAGVMPRNQNSVALVNDLDEVVVVPVGDGPVESQNELIEKAMKEKNLKLPK